MDSAIDRLVKSVMIRVTYCFTSHKLDLLLTIMPQRSGASELFWHPAVALIDVPPCRLSVTY